MKRLILILSMLTVSALGATDWWVFLPAHKTCAPARGYRGVDMTPENVLEHYECKVQASQDKTLLALDCSETGLHAVLLYGITAQACLQMAQELGTH